MTIRLTQSAEAEYLSEELNNDAKRTILTELFDSIVYKDNAVSVTYSFLVQAIAEKSQKSRAIMEGENMLNRTNKNDPDYRVQNEDNLQMELLSPVWQGWLDEDRTFLSVSENAILESGEKGSTEGKLEC